MQRLLSCLASGLWSWLAVVALFSLASCGAPDPGAAETDVESVSQAVNTGLCKGVVCTRLDECHARGVCDPNTGVCSNPLRADGSKCNDGDPCTVGSTCLGGVCQKGTPKVCTTRNA